jgi:hypothetical protein
MCPVDHKDYMSGPLDIHDDQSTYIILLEEGWTAYQSLDNRRVAMLNAAVDWISEETGLEKSIVRRHLKSGHELTTNRALRTIKSVRQFLQGDQ